VTEAALAGVPPGYRCETCGFELWLPIAELSCSTLGLYDDARFPGRCLLVLHEHVEDLTTLPTAIAHHFLDDLRAAERAIRVVTGAGRMNWAVLGNVEPHLHAHLVPRTTGGATATLSPWEHPLTATRLQPERRDQLMRFLSAEVAHHAGASMRAARS